MTHICVGKLTIIGSDNGLSPGRRQAIIWTNAGILLIEPLGTNFSEILIGIQIFSFTKMPLKMSSAKWRLFGLGLNDLTTPPSGQWVNSMRPSEACMRHQSRQSLVQIMVCLVFDTKPLSEPMLYYCQLDPGEQISVKLYSKFEHFHSRKCVWKCHLKNVGRFVSASIS